MVPSVRQVLMVCGLFCSTMAVSPAADSVFPKYYGPHDHGFDEALAVEAKADYSIGYHNDGRMTVHIGKVRDAAIPKIREIRFSYNELSQFFKTRQPKNFIVVTLDKSMRTDAEDKALVRRLNDYFFQIGFRRVRIHQGLGDGVGVLSDGMNPKSGPR